MSRIQIPTMLRLFIALPLQREVTNALGNIIESLRPLGSGVRWVKAESIHLTVKFLGDTDRSLVGPIERACDEVATCYQPFETRLDRLGGFPNLNRPRVIWVDSSEPRHEAADLVGELDAKLHQLGFAPETKPFKPHLTLGRVRPGKPLEALSDRLQAFKLSPMVARYDRLILFQSTLTPQGAVHERLHEAKLGAERFG